MAYKVTDKIVGLVDHPDYTWCLTEDEFRAKIIHKNYNPVDYTAMTKQNLIEKNMIDELEDLWQNQFISQTFDEATQTIHRERIFFDKEEFDTSKTISKAVDYVALFGEELYTMVLVSEEII